MTPASTIQVDFQEVNSVMEVFAHVTYSFLISAVIPCGCIVVSIVLVGCKDCSPQCSHPPRL
eukprot:1748150-Amphidinium_carterae.1